MAKRIFDLLASVIGLMLLSPVLGVFVYLVWLQDKHSPFYYASRVGKNDKPFKMLKLRSMVVDADKNGVSSTASDDKRITSFGRVIRRYKIDELFQLWNVIKGDMSLVGPRPNLMEEIQSYTNEELTLLSVRPGMTDFSSIIFADEGEILLGFDNPDEKYNQTIRPWKSRLGLLYIKEQNIFLDVLLIMLTFYSGVNRKATLLLVVRLLEHYGAESRLVSVAGRNVELYAYPPPGLLTAAVDGDSNSSSSVGV